MPSINAFTELVRSNIVAEFEVKDVGTVKELPMDKMLGLTLPSTERWGVGWGERKERERIVKTQSPLSY